MTIKEKLIRFLTDLGELDKHLMLFVFLNGLLFQHILASNSMHFPHKVMALSFILTLVFISSWFNGFLNKMEEQRYDTTLD